MQQSIITKINDPIPTTATITYIEYCGELYEENIEGIVCEDELFPSDIFIPDADELVSFVDKEARSGNMINPSDILTEG